MRLFLLTTLTMIAFAGNSVLARLALADGAIDAANYSLLRLAAGVGMLLIVTWWLKGVGRNEISRQSNWASAAALFVYIAGFSYAYLALETGMGALILFSCVQATMIGWGLYKGDRPALLEWVGLVIAFGSFVFLMAPSAEAPPVLASVLMAIAGIGWGIYSVRGRSAVDPLLTTTGNFARAVPFALVLSILTMGTTQISSFGVLMAVLSGAVTSGLGYALWYQCLPLLTATRGAIVQLSVPVIATAGGIAFAGEVLTVRFAVCSALILLGIAFSVLAKSSRA